MKLKITLAVLSAAILAGCASPEGDKQRELELLAANRANLLASELPMEAGPLSIMRANSKGTMIEIMMVYNQDAQGAKPLKQVLRHSVNSYCTNPDTKNNLEVGLSYRLKMRNSRGQLMVDEIVTKQTCQAATP
ncbi:GspS/AspS pilotin family protein [Vibrio sp. Isolate23]|uniref:GspS/AspS pilotin family protein n=1 Tax=Vibrio TaxID=662 RepID=UPI001EFE859E|nr:MULTISPECIES: GspS/AspS pilotin family protein [Vibrio]MCG9679816.1 GspS/AspS pilotin family protein [Vibrio sp. Isolate24]MCG9682635.1 GspS/AspS pilotin family protein [Vibrio sp. Isolate23]USD33512.1 GspS/AspS pilotin family protein [Vibrio sp. SCSIO 43186]USD46581.1 GspS/AspS pilotin family protein [Vibrio sp. SCSIO 43145]USD70636.1 GspS/AspS pilotin family protein [Vibrio sp. SCSIO 43139]